MLKVFIGYLLISFQMTAPFGFDLLVDFVGYFLIFLGLFSQRSKSRWFAIGAPVSLVMTFVSMISPAQQFLHFYMSPVAVNGVFDLMLAANIFILLTIVLGVIDVEDTQYVDLGSTRLKVIWVIQSLLQLACGVLIWFVTPTAATLAGVFSLITFGLTISTVVCLMFLYSLIKM